MPSNKFSIIFFNGKIFLSCKIKDSFRKFQGNFMEISYKIYENLRSIENNLRKFVKSIG